MANNINGHEDLQWLHGSASAAMGIQSSFESVRQVILNGTASKSSMGDSMSDSRLQAASRYREITERLCKLSSEHQDILHAAYSQRQYSDAISKAFGFPELPGKFIVAVTPFTRAANKFLDEDKGDDFGFFAWLEGVVAREEGERVAAIKKEARTRFDKAIKAYEDIEG